MTNISITHMIVTTVWGSAKNVLGMFGLKPVYVLYIVCGLFALGVAAQIKGAWSDRSSWTFDPSKTPRKRTQ